MRPILCSRCRGWRGGAACWGWWWWAWLLTGKDESINGINVANNDFSNSACNDENMDFLSLKKNSS